MTGINSSEAALHGSCAAAVDAVLAAKNAPAADLADGAVVLPEGQRLDGPLAQAIVDALPDGTMFGFNSDAEMTPAHAGVVARILLRLTEDGKAPDGPSCQDPSARRSLAGSGRTTAAG